jgi:hypothetical protein
MVVTTGTATDRRAETARVEEPFWSASTVLVLVGAAAVLVSGWVHFYLYFRGGYRGIAPESFGGVTISRSFVLNAVGALLIAEALLLSLAFRRLLVPAALAGIGFGLATLTAYSLSRTSGLLGFTETATTAEAVIGIVSEGIAVLALSARLALHFHFFSDRTERDSNRI